MVERIRLAGPHPAISVIGSSAHLATTRLERLERAYECASDDARLLFEATGISILCSMFRLSGPLR